MAGKVFEAPLAQQKEAFREDSLEVNGFQLVNLRLIPVILSRHKTHMAGK